MEADRLKEILRAHADYLAGTGGERANLSGADLYGANLRGADLYGANLRDANLRDADLRDADLSYANLRDADLRGADLYGANLRDANLRDANLRDADLRDAELSDADLRGADLRGADLSGANLRDADLSDAFGIEHASAGWSGHGERGRTLTGVVIDGVMTLHCGCFSGSVFDLEEYIAHGSPALVESRTLAMRIVVGLLLFGPRREVK